MIGVPALGRLLTVAMPDQADIRVFRHLMLRIVLPHRRPERLGGGEVLVRGEVLAMKHQREVLGERLRQRLSCRGIDRLR